jgi:DNA gyrase subunit A
MADNNEIFNENQNEDVLDDAQILEDQEEGAEEGPDVDANDSSVESVSAEGQSKEILTAELGKEMQQSFLEYSMSVIVARALPDVRDGLKPVHRRILYAMNESGYRPDKAHMKSARTVGDVIGKYHPHGDVAVYDTMVRMAQPFSMRVPLVDGHGNFGSIDGDSAAAMRYTEARLDKPAMELLRDLNKETVDFQPNYDESLQEPKVLPARFPNLLVNGSNGIAVGMATNIPPHNLGETIDATCMMIDNPDITTAELMKALPGPDFPTGGLIMGRKGIIDAYETGHGNITIRAKCEIEEKKNGRSSIIVKEIPYQVNRKRLLEKLGELVRDKKLPEISNIHDAADRRGIDIIIDLKANAIPQVVLNKLYKHTQLSTGFGINMLALVDDTPKVLSLREMLHYYIQHQIEVVTRRTKYDLQKAEEQAHILEGYLIALDNIDEVIAIIRGSQTDQEASQKLMERFGLSKIQTTKILEMQLRRLTGLERAKIEEQLAELRKEIEYYKSLLADETLLRNVIKEELQDIKKRFNTPRKTKITHEADDIDAEDLIADDNMVVTMTKAGYIKRMPVSAYKQQKRGGKGINGVNLKDSDFVEHLFVATNLSYMLFFTTTGKVYRRKVWEIPEASRHARGTAIVNLLSLEKGETVSAVISTKEFPADEFLIFATAQGMIKKTAMDLYDRTRSEGLIAINLKEGDSLISVKRVAPGEKLIMVSSVGKAILCPESEVRPMGRGTTGVKGMNIAAGAKVLGMEIVKPDTDLFVITEKGYGKRTPISEYPEHHRGGQGVYTITMTQKKGLLTGMKIVKPDEELMIISEEGVIVRTPVDGISELGRAAQGVKVMNVNDGDKVSAIAITQTATKRQKKDSTDTNVEEDIDILDELEELSEEM